MLKILNNRIRDLIREESGVVLAFTVTVFLLMFLFASSIYAVGETIRQRIELQNAADAAAYSAALVQADTLSRVAVINRAMSWTYVMMTRHQMDYIVDKWLHRVVDQWNTDNTRMVNWFNSGCRLHPSRPIFLSVGIPDRFVNLNSQIVSVNNIQTQLGMADAIMKSNRTLGRDIDNDKQNITAMNLAELNLLNSMKERIDNVIENVIKNNVSLTPNDRVVNSKDEITHCILSQNALDYMEVLRAESKFLQFGGFVGNARNVMGNGTDVWMILNNNGIQRDYFQTASLLAIWNYWSTKWVGRHPYCGPVPTSGNSFIPGDSVRDQRFSGITAKPYILTRDYFSPDGAIIVGASRPLNNPFAFMFANEGGKVQGLFSAFSLNKASIDRMWCVSAARAGFADRANNIDGYRNRRGDVDAVWNLSETNWDAMLLPVGKDDTTGTDILEKVAGEMKIAKSKTKETVVDYKQAVKHVFH